MFTNTFEVSDDIIFLPSPGKRVPGSKILQLPINDLIFALSRLNFSSINSTELKIKV